MRGGGCLDYVAEGEDLMEGYEILLACIATAFVIGAVVTIIGAVFGWWS